MTSGNFDRSSSLDLLQIKPRLWVNVLYLLHAGYSGPPSVPLLWFHYIAGRWEIDWALVFTTAEGPGAVEHKRHALFLYAVYCTAVSAGLTLQP